MTFDVDGSDCKDEPIDHRDSQRPARCRGPKLETKGITCWLATDGDVDPLVAAKMRVSGESETISNQKTGTTTVRTSVFISDREGLPASCEYDVYWNCGTTPLSLSCIVYSKSPRGAEKVETNIWSCSSKPTTQSRTTKFWRKRAGDKFYRPKPQSTVPNNNMGSIRVEMYRLKSTVTVLNVTEDGYNEVEFDTLDEHSPWVVFEFNFKWHDPAPRLSLFGSPLLVQLGTKRQRESSPPPMQTTSTARASHRECSPITISDTSSPSPSLSNTSDIASRHQRGVSLNGPPPQSSVSTSGTRMRAVVGGSSPSTDMNTTTRQCIPQVEPGSASNSRINGNTQIGSGLPSPGLTARIRVQSVALLDKDLEDHKEVGRRLDAELARKEEQVLQVKNEALAKVKAENEAKRQKLAEWDQLIEELSKQ